MSGDCRLERRVRPPLTFKNFFSSSRCCLLEPWFGFIPSSPKVLTWIKDNKVRKDVGRSCSMAEKWGAHCNKDAGGIQRPKLLQSLLRPEGRSLSCASALQTKHLSPYPPPTRPSQVLLAGGG